MHLKYKYDLTIKQATIFFRDNCQQVLMNSNDPKFLDYRLEIYKSTIFLFDANTR